VRWDGRRVQIADFSLATVIGAPRTAIGALPWAAPEQREGHISGKVSDKDDIWAAGRLIYYVRTGEELTSRDKLADWPALESLLDGVFGPPAGRPSASEMLVGRLGEPNPVPRGPDIEWRLEEGRQRFYALRASKHPGTAPTEPSRASGSPPSAQADPDPAQADKDGGARRAPRRFRRRAGGEATMLALIGIVTWLLR
jgi:serine/threonine protein kinase